MWNCLWSLTVAIKWMGLHVTVVINCVRLPVNINCMELPVTVVINCVRLPVTAIIPVWDCP